MNDNGTAEVAEQVIEKHIDAMKRPLVIVIGPVCGRVCNRQAGGVQTLLQLVRAVFASL